MHFSKLKLATGRYRRRRSALRRRTVSQRLVKRASRLEPLETRRVLDSTVVFSEIMYNPAGATDDSMEWIELHNQMSKAMDISNWSIEGGINYTFPEGTAVTGDDYILIAIHPSSLGIADVLGPYTGNLANDGEELRLVSNNGRVMNVVNYQDNGHWPVGPDGSGVSLAKRNRNAASHPPENWTVSAQVGGTPGTHNFPTDTDDEPEIPFQKVVFPGSPSRVLIPTHAGALNYMGVDWQMPTFDDQHAPGWMEHTLGVGFDTTGSSAAGPLIHPAGNLQSEMFGVSSTALMRTEFEIVSPGGFEEMQLSIPHDDGFVAWLNGNEIARSNALEPTPAFDAVAVIGASGGELTPIEYDPLSQLSGTNFNTHFLDSSLPGFGVPGPYGVGNNLNDAGWIWKAGAYFDVDFGEAQVISGFRAYSVYTGGSRGVNLAVEHSDDGISFSSTDGGLFNLITLAGKGVNGEGLPENTGSGFGGWYEFQFNSSSTPHQHWRIRHDGGESGGHAPRLGEIEFLGPSSTEFNLTEHVALLKSGTNVLAIQGLNLAADDADFAIQPTLQILPAPIPENPLAEVPFDGNARVLIPTQGNQLSFAGRDWNDPDFNDQSAPGWFDATYGVGFDTVGTSEVGPLIHPAGNLRTSMFTINSSAFVRSQFTIDDPSALSALQMELDYDDGFVAYLNGTEVARSNAPSGTPSFDATAGSGSTAPAPLSIDITTQGSGTNFGSHFGFGSSPWGFADPAPYGVANNTNDVGWIWSRGGYLDVDFGAPHEITAFRAYSVYTGSSRGATFVVEHSDDGTNFSREDGGSFPLITQAGVGVDENGNPEMAGNGYAGWYQLDFNPANISHQHWRVRLDGVLVAHAPRLAELQFIGLVNPQATGTRFDITPYLGDLQIGTNTLAIQGLNDAADDSDFLLRPQILTRMSSDPTEEPSLPRAVINEVASAADENFFVEIHNLGNQHLNLLGYMLKGTGTQGDQYTFGADAIAGSGFLTLTAAELGFQPQDGEKLFLYAFGGTQLVDARVVTNRLRGRSSQHDGDWLYPETPTPGAANVFDFEDQIVINEIMYHHQPDYGTDDTPATHGETTLLPIDHLTWRYNQTSGFNGGGIGTNWYTTAHPIGTPNWSAGPAPLGYETSPSSLPLSINTDLAAPPSNNPFIRTTYFETDFVFNGNLDDVAQLQLTHLIDDGAVFYLNGQEIERFNMMGNPTVETLANTTVNNASLVTSGTLSKDALQTGTNRLSAEVHQATDQSSDLIFAASLSALTELTPAIEGLPYFENSEEWIELYNRGTAAVDLSQWSLRDGIDFDFPNGTELAAGQYLVVANNAAGLATEFPGVNVLGDFSRNLSNHSDTLLLRDANKNPADEVTYFDGGRWPEFADGGGSSLELRDGDADNSIAAAWAASNEAEKSPWQTYTFRQVASPDTTSPYWNEFLFGFLDNGEVLIDDVSVVSNPGGANTQLIQNGSFQSDSIGQTPSKWRIMGTHQGTVVTDPADPNNKVLHLVAYGPTDENHNKAETTFVDNRSIVDGTEYQFTFRAKWLTGSRKLNARLYLSRVAKTFTLDAPQNNGTPGQPNSVLDGNIGPTFSEFQHAPVIPAASQEVTVTVAVDDPDGVSSLNLFWRTSSSGSFTNVPMQARGDHYTAPIIGQPAATVVQFYVEARDALGATSTLPATGPDSRALYIVNDNQAGTGPLRNFRFIMFSDEASDLFTPINQGSNRFVGATAVDNETEVFYDVGAKLRGSPIGRTNANRQSSYNIQFHSEQPFRGVHNTVILDTSGPSSLLGSGAADEVLATHLMNRAGMHVSMYHDVVRMLVPNNYKNGPAVMGLARYSNSFLQEQFGDNSDGTVYDFNKINALTQTDDGSREGFKLNTPQSYRNTDFQDLGDDKEKYRWNILPKSHIARDDFAGVIAMSKAFSTSSDNLDAATQATMDMDSWLMTFALQSLIGNLDAYTVVASTHNLRLYTRPDNQKVMAMPWDMDHLWMIAPDSVLHGHHYRNLTRIINLPNNLRRYYGILLDMIDTTFNSAYVTPWAQDQGKLVGRGYTGHVSYIQNRANYVTSQINSRAPQIPFEINSDDPLNVGSDSQATITGSGWVNVDQIRLASNGQVLAATWSGDGSVANTWQVTVPVNGIQPVTLEAYDFQGQLIDSETINVISSTPNPVVDSLRITEINYNPADLTDAELSTFGSLNNDDFEFIELQNIGSTPLQLLGTQFTDGVEFVFPTVELQPGERGLVVKDTTAFARRYGTGLNVLGQFTSGGLSNGGERITLVDSLGQTVLDFSYDDNDPWPQRADGSGGTLQLKDAATTPVDQYGKHYHWRGSTHFHGSPGSPAAEPPGIVINEILARTDAPVATSDTVELYNPTATAIDIGLWWISDSDQNLLKYQIPAGTVLNPGQYLVLDESHFNPTPLAPGPDDFALSGTAGDDLWLVISDGNGGVQTLVDDVHFAAAANGESIGRVPNGSGSWAPLQATSLGSPNSEPRVGPLVISELNYHPGTSTVPLLTAETLEFVEIQNPTAVTVDLTAWQIRGGVDYDFPPGTILAAGQVLVVTPFNPASAENSPLVTAFRAHYGIDSSVTLLGGYANRLNDSFEQLLLKRAGTPPADDPTLIPCLAEDTVLYDDLDPWPTTADGTGHSLQRISITGRGDQSSSWTAAAPSPGSVSSSLPGDFNSDWAVDDTDIDLLFAAIVAGGHDLHYDLDGSGSATMDDVTLLVSTLLATNFGDTDLDQDIDTGDLTRAIINFTGAGSSGKTWSQGDTDGDGDVDTRDLTTAIINFTGARSRLTVTNSQIAIGFNVNTSPVANTTSGIAAATIDDTLADDPLSNDRHLSNDRGSRTSRADLDTVTNAALEILAGRANRLHTQRPELHLDNLDQLFTSMDR